MDYSVFMNHVRRESTGRMTELASQIINKSDYSPSLPLEFINMYMKQSNDQRKEELPELARLLTSKQTKTSKKQKNVKLAPHSLFQSANIQIIVTR